MSDRLYDTPRWRKARRAFLAANPLCAECKKMGRYTPANTVDHIKPHKGDEVLFWDQDNWAALCAPCHSVKTASEDGGYGNKGGLVKPRGCGVDGMPSHPSHPWNQ